MASFDKRSARGLLAFAVLALCGCGGGGSDSGGGDGGNGTSPPPSGHPDSGVETVDAGTPAPGVEGGSPAPPGEGGTSLVPIGAPSAATIADAVAAGLSYYHRNASTGDIWCLPCDGAPVTLAAASYTGQTSADARLLAQMRYLLQTGNEPFGTGGYAANDERNATAMYAIAKLVPRVWSQLTSSEVHLIDTIMEATFVSDVYATADATNASGAPRTFDGSNDSNRDYNPNYREGMIGAVIVGAEYFGVSAAKAMLASYDHAAFTASLQTLGLQNLYWTFDTYQSNPSAGAPSPQTVEQGIQNYAMHGMTLDQLLDLYVYLASDTFSAQVSCGLNDGAGIESGGKYAGRILAGCSGLPNLGMTGMELEFDSVDADGPRSSQSYARLGLRDDLFNQLVVVVYGDWSKTTQAQATLGPVAIGVTDYFYKATEGYEDYSEGIDQGEFQCGTSTDCALNQAMWTEILAPFHSH